MAEPIGSGGSGSALKPASLASPILIGFDQPIAPRSAAIAFLIAFAISAVPLGFATYPPLHDYPFHIARLYILEHWTDLPPLRDWYDIRSFLLPNVGMDVIALLLAKLLPVALAGRIFVALTLGLMLSGCLILHRFVHGYFTLWPLVSSLLLFNWIFLYGFLNYLLGIGVMLWAAGIWLALRRSAPWQRIAAGTVLSTALLFCHFVALALFAIIVAGYELPRSAVRFHTEQWPALRDLIVGAAIFVIPLLLFLLSPTAGEAGNTFAYNQPWLLWKGFSFYRGLMAGSWTLDTLLLAAMIVCAFIIGCYGRLIVAKSMYLVLALLLVAYLVAPMRTFGAFFVDTRLPIAIAFVAIGATQPVLGSGTLNRAVLPGLVVLLVVRSIVLSYDWSAYDRVIREFTAAFAGLPPSAILFVASEASAPSIADVDLRLWQPPVKHVVSLATLEQTVFVPATWAHPSQQPITVTSKYAAMYNFQRQNPITVKSAEELAAVAGQIRALAAESALPPAPLYLLVLYPQSLPRTLPPGTEVVGSGSRFILLALTPPRTGRPGNSAGSTP